MVLADSISVPCDFKEGRGAREEFELQGERASNGSFQSSGRAGDVNVNLSFDHVSGRTLVVSYFHEGANLQLSNTRTGTGTIEYKRGLLSRALGAPRDISVRCHPQNLEASQRSSQAASRNTPVVEQYKISSEIIGVISPLGSSELLSKSSPFVIQEGIVVASPDRNKSYCRVVSSNQNSQNNFEGDFSASILPQGSIMTASLSRNIGSDSQRVVLICTKTPSVESLQETLGDMVEIKSSEE